MYKRQAVNVMGEVLLPDHFGQGRVVFVKATHAVGHVDIAVDVYKRQIQLQLNASMKRISKFFMIEICFMIL